MFRNMFRKLRELFMNNDLRFSRVTPQEARAVLADQSVAIMIDVREVDEVAGSAVPGALNIPRSFINTEIGLVLNDYDTPVFLCCAAGGRAMMAAETLCDMGYRNVNVIDASHREILQAFRS